MKAFIKSLKKNKEIWLAIGICFSFFIAYLTLGLVKHSHFLTGYDLSLVNQVTWEYSRFISPVMTGHAYAFMPAFYDHIEFIYLLLSPFYWILPDARTLIILQASVVAVSGYFIFLLAKKHKINLFVSLSLMFAYFTFYGVQFALWSDVHSLVFGASFLAIFIYFLDTNRNKLAFLFFLLAITSKEDIGFITLFISFVYLLLSKRKINLLFMLISAAYIFIIFFIYYPNFTWGYTYAGDSGLLSGIDPREFIDTPEKRDVFFYSFISNGFISLLNPFYLFPFLADLGHYFVLGNERVTSAQGLFGHYRFTSSLLLIWPTILIIGKYKKLNNKYLSLYILFFAALTTYMLHAPLTYLTKSWFWTTPSGVKNINQAIEALPKDAYVVTQVNISPHISNRKLIVTMWGEGKDFSKNSPCREPSCKWFKWAGEPQYMIVDTSPEWNIINLLATREDFIDGLNNMEKTGTIKIYKEFGSAKIYTVEKRPF
ncbi:MAG: DUF2079 domain-containing protein [Candidatus Levybacteria bacterium]|nr:DUF2079 domain-containing protein [Candidatus Levybacteria bacterium]